MILGGGFGGLTAARRLSKSLSGPSAWLRGLPQIELTLIERSDRFCFKPLLYDLLTDEVHEAEISPRYEDVLDSARIRRVQAEIRRVDLQAHEVFLQGSSGPIRLPFDGLLIAIGARTCFFEVPGAAEHAFAAATQEDFLRLRAHIDEIASRPTARGTGREGQRLRSVAVVGAGPSGVETALKLADKLAARRPRFKLVLLEAGNALLPGFHDGVRQAALRALHERGVEVRLNASVQSVGPHGLSLRAEAPAGLRAARLRAVTVIWTAGMHGHALARGFGAALDSRDRLHVGPTLELPGWPGVFAIGDCACLQASADDELPATAQVAVQQADVAAANLLERALGSGALKTFSYRELGQTISLGRGRDVLRLPGLTLEGSSATALRRLIYLARLPGGSHRARVGIRWAARALGARLRRPTGT
ncbi:MAG: NAD(P)/FAD-dependent oxidoreductase [Planctomycetota bacterium]